MEYVASAAATLLGLALGLVFGRLLNAIMVHWEGVATAVKWSAWAVAFLVGAGGGAAILRVLSGPNQPAFYLLGLAVGVLIAFFFVKVPPRYPPDLFKNVVSMSDDLRDEVRDPDKRALLIEASFVPPEAIQRATGMDKGKLAHELEQAADSLRAPGQPPGSHGRNH